MYHKEDFSTFSLQACAKDFVKGSFYSEYTDMCSSYPQTDEVVMSMSYSQHHLIQILYLIFQVRNHLGFTSTINYRYTNILQCLKNFNLRKKKESVLSEKKLPLVTHNFPKAMPRKKDTQTYILLIRIQIQPNNFL